MVSECFVVLTEAERRDELELLAFEAEPTCWRSFVSRRGVTETIKPDVSLAVGLGDYIDHWLLECDRSTENLAFIRRKLSSYVRYWQAGREAVFPRVLWVTARPERVVALAGLLEALPHDQRQLFAVCQADSFVDRIKQGAIEAEGPGSSRETNRNEGR